jgi:hypothetical protein
MNSDNELRNLWCGTAVGESPMNPEQLLEMAKRRTAEFDRLIRRRNRREICVAIFVAVFFAWSAFKTDATFARIGMIVVSVSMLWIVGYMLRFGRNPVTPDASADSETYRRALVEGYDRQIRLLSTVKYWYLLPPYLGMMLLWAAGLFDRPHPGWAAYISPVILTAVYAGVWYLNEVYAVGKLRAARAIVVRTLGTERAV